MGWTFYFEYFLLICIYCINDGAYVTLQSVKIIEGLSFQCPVKMFFTFLPKGVDKQAFR